MRGGDRASNYICQRGNSFLLSQIAKTAPLAWMSTMMCWWGGTVSRFDGLLRTISRLHQSLANATRI